jgi:hypothetical protein
VSCRWLSRACSFRTSGLIRIHEEDFGSLVDTYLRRRVASSSTGGGSDFPCSTVVSARTHPCCQCPGDYGRIERSVTALCSVTLVEVQSFSVDTGLCNILVLTLFNQLENAVSSTVTGSISPCQIPCTFGLTWFSITSAFLLRKLIMQLYIQGILKAICNCMMGMFLSRSPIWQYSVLQALHFWELRTARSSKLLYDWWSASMSWYRAPLWDSRPDITSCRNVAVCNLRSCLCGAPSLTRGRLC